MDLSFTEEKGQNSNSLKDQESYLVEKLKRLFSGDYQTDDFLKLSKKEQIQKACDFIKSEEEGFRNNFKILPDHMIQLFVAMTFDEDSGNSLDKPDWLDIEKFKRGQKFGFDNFSGLSFSETLSLFAMFSFENGIKPLIVTGKSSTPYTAFKRYLSTGIRIRNWYTEDPWTKGTAAYNDIQIVRKMHNAVRKGMKESSHEEREAAAKIENPYCPTKDIISEDFQSSYPVPFLGQCPYLFNRNPELKDVWPTGLSQGFMAATQFAFFGLMILYPTFFGVHNATSEDFEAFCHTWRGIGYLLGIDDEFNLCRGTLTEIKQLCKDFLELWVIPNFRELSPECEHMMRCLMEGNTYYFPGSSYETSVFYFSELLNLDTPKLYSSLTYKNWMSYIFSKCYYQYLCQVPGMMALMNKKLNSALDKAVEFSAEKHEELKNRSEESLKKISNKK